MAVQDKVALTQGSTHANVAYIQNKLVEHGAARVTIDLDSGVHSGVGSGYYMNPEGGTYGVGTMDAMKKFQADNGLTVDGLVATDGPEYDLLDATPAGAVVGFMPADVLTTLSAETITSEATIWDPTAGTRFVIQYAVLTTTANGDVTFRDNTAGDTIKVATVSTGGATLISFVDSDNPNGVYSETADNVLTAEGSVAMDITGYLIGREV